MAFACKPTVALSATSASSFRGNSLSARPVRFAAPTSHNTRLVVQAKESRIGKMAVVIPKGVDVTIDGQAIRVKGPKGELSRDFPKQMSIAMEDGKIRLRKVDESLKARQLHGLCRSLTQNMVTGVSEGFEKKLKMVGVGYKAAMEGTTLVLNVGFSHPVRMEPPAGVTAKVERNTELTITGYDKEQVGNFAAIIRKVRPPEPYKGKGIKYDDEVILRKEGKTGKK